MKITYKGDYALKALLHLARHFAGGDVVPISEIAAANDIPRKFLEQIMLILKGAGLVDSRRGIGGGFFLRKPPGEIVLGEVVRLIEGDIEPIACAKTPPVPCCADIGSCVFREIWVEVTAAVTAIVDHLTFADILRREQELRVSQGSYTYEI
ncbi:MAG: Rrf2 family transcriptional regulator [Deltaproteobacteria bacterium]|nr:Rrf2 family transcriptional regulator [Deltaproteobacteria bacterium]